MVCAGLNTSVNSNIVGFLSYPTSCDPFFYLKILVALWVVLTFILYNRDKDKLIKADFLSSMGVSSLAIIFIALIGTLVGFIQSDIFIYILVGGLVFIAIWLFKD